MIIIIFGTEVYLLFTINIMQFAFINISLIHLTSADCTVANYGWEEHLPKNNLAKFSYILYNILL